MFKEDKKVKEVERAFVQADDLNDKVKKVKKEK